MASLRDETILAERYAGERCSGMLSLALGPSHLHCLPPSCVHLGVGTFSKQEDEQTPERTVFMAGMVATCSRALREVDGSHSPERCLCKPRYCKVYIVVIY